MESVTRCRNIKYLLNEVKKNVQQNTKNIYFKFLYKLSVLCSILILKMS